MRIYLTLVAMLLVAACTKTNQSDAHAATGAQENGASNAAGPAPAPTAGLTGLAGRTGELANPDATTMVFLYYELARMPPPIDNWVEDDRRVRSAPAPDKAAQRTAVRTELEFGADAVRGVGFIRLPLHANLSDYDPTYGEFTVRALAPSSVVSFDALGQKLSLKFGNGRNAQIWRVAQADAQAIRDKIGYGYGSVSLDALLRITAVQPGPGGGTITADVVEYELREDRSGVTLARVQVAQK